MKIYTRNGDKGYTSTYGGEKIWKGGLLMELQGSIDEVNAGTGYLRSLNRRMTDRKDLDDMLEWIQYCLFRIGADVSMKFQQSSMTEGDILKLEEAIDNYTQETGELANFIHLGGNEAAAYAQVVRSVARRAERVFARVLEETAYTLDYQYINRLADYFFQLGRYFNFVNGDQEEAMVPRD